MAGVLVGSSVGSSAFMVVQVWQTGASGSWNSFGTCSCSFVGYNEKGKAVAFYRQQRKAKAYGENCPALIFVDAGLPSYL